MIKLSLLLILINMTTHLCAQGNAAARYEIDAKRIGVNPLGKDALPRSREFIRLDSTYYVGYLFEGLYKADKSSDFLGYKNAIAPLRKAFILLRKDYGKNLQTIFISPQIYIQFTGRYIDFLQVSNTLKECYANIERPDSVMWVLNAISAYNFPKDHLGVNTAKAWTYHRNRFLTSNKYAFLKNSVAENEQMAFGFCYAALAKIQANRTKNDLWFGPMQAEADRQNVYHYLSLLHSYLKNYDSSEYYYQRMAQMGAVSWNNYGSLKLEIGELAVANTFYEKDKFKYPPKMLKEPFYYIPILDIIAGRTKQAMQMCKDIIQQEGSSPGFGWYNIALGRSYLYDGQLDSAEYVLKKAADFKEIHIGTTLTQTQYEFTINLLKLQLVDRKIQLLKFENKGWWYSPTALYKIGALKIEKNLLQYILVNEMAANPERDRTVYDLFCGESTTTFDEAFYLIKDFTPSYFIKKYNNYQKVDPRNNIQRYFRLFSSKMQWVNGDEKQAFDGYKLLANDKSADASSEKLFLGRLYEGLANGSKNAGDDEGYYSYASLFYENYPQLIPFSGIRLKVKLTQLGVNDNNVSSVIKSLKQCNIEWVETIDRHTIEALLNFKKIGDKYQVVISTKSGNNNVVVNGEKMIFKTTEGAGKEIALRIFGKGGAMVLE